MCIRFSVNVDVVLRRDGVGDRNSHAPTVIAISCPVIIVLYTLSMCIYTAVRCLLLSLSISRKHREKFVMSFYFLVLLMLNYIVSILIFI